MLICDIAQVGATAHYVHLVLHAGLAAAVSVGGSIFLFLGFRANRRARRVLGQGEAQASI